MKLGVVLLALLLAGMAMVPMVSAAQEEQDNPIELMDNYSVSTVELMNDPAIKTIIQTAKLSEKIPSGEKNQTFLNNYESPAEIIIKKMKSKGYSESQITAVLKSEEYGWDPKTGACWKGTAPTEEELKMINQIRGEDYSPFNHESDVFDSTLETKKFAPGIPADENFIRNNVRWGKRLHETGSDGYQFNRDISAWCYYTCWTSHKFFNRMLD
jgi:hypothetical protein